MGRPQKFELLGSGGGGALRLSSVRLSRDRNPSDQAASLVPFQNEDHIWERPVKALVVVCHPAADSFNHALAEAVRAAWTSGGVMSSFMIFTQKVLIRFCPRPKLGARRPRTRQSQRILPSFVPVICSVSFIPIAGALRRQ